MCHEFGWLRWPFRRWSVAAAVGLWAVLLVPFQTLIWNDQEFSTAAAQRSAAATPVGLGAPSRPSFPYWTQLGADGSLQARAVVNGDCPTISVDGSDRPMTVRAPENDQAFADTVCEIQIPSNSQRASIENRPLALLPERIDHVAAIGDTGCRVSRWDPPQDCGAATDWPLRAIATRLAAERPDLIVHVGDYIYREAPCPPGIAACAGSPWGDNQATWQADVFDPMGRLLPVAPWVFLRGNHESCSREGVGWFRYFDPRPMPKGCERFTEPYSLELAGLPPLVVVDTAEAGDTQSSSELNRAYREQLSAVERLAKPNSWLLTHKPIAGGVLLLDGREQVVTNATFQSIAASGLPSSIDLVISGHIHLAEALLFAESSGRPTQLITGNGGTRLDSGVDGVYAGAFLGDAALGAGIVAAEFGWLRIDFTDNRTSAQALDRDGRTLFTIQLDRV